MRAKILHMPKLFLLLVVMTFLLSTEVGIALANHRANGNGTCWNSGYAWAVHSTDYRTDTSVPSSWSTSISNAASAWNGVTTSSFVISSSALSANTIYKGRVSNNTFVAETLVYPHPSTPNTLSRMVTTFNQNLLYTVSLPPPPNTYVVQNVMTHEFGHWVFLGDQSGFSCSEVTMYGVLSPGETKRQTLETADKNGVSWQYP